MIAATFAHLDVVKSRGGYTLVDPSSGTPLTLERANRIFRAETIFRIQASR